MKILKFQKNKVYLEDGEIIDINRDIKGKYSIKEGVEITLEIYKNIIYDSALSKSFFLLSKRDYTNKELFQKLEKKYKKTPLTKTILLKVMKKVLKLGYIDDYSYTKSYMNKKSNLGIKRIRYELKLKGIDPFIIEEVYEKTNKKISEIEKINKLMCKIYKKERNKQIAYLMRRGFDLNDILEVLKGLG